MNVHGVTAVTMESVSYEGTEWVDITIGTEGGQLRLALYGDTKVLDAIATQYGIPKRES